MDQAALVRAAQGGDEDAFSALVAPLLSGLRAYSYRMLAHPEDADDAVQDTLVRALASIDRLARAPAFKTWLFRIATRVCLDALRARTRWRTDAQIDAERFAKSPGNEAVLRSIMDTMDAAEYRFDFREHIAFCFSCVSRSLPPHQQAALLLVDVFQFSGREAAGAVDVNESVLRHHLAAARKHMRETYDSLCALVDKAGVCYQCEVLRDASPADRRGDAVEPLPPGERDDRYRARLRVIRDADLERGPSHALHAQIFRVTAQRQRQLQRPAAGVTSPEPS